MKNIKKRFKNIKKKIKALWKKDPKNIIMPIVIFIIFIIISFFTNVIFGLIILILMSVCYYKLPDIINLFVKKDKNIKEDKMNKVSKKKKSKKLKIVLLVILCLFILSVIGMIAFFGYIVIKAPEFNEDLLYVTEPSIMLDKDGNEIAKLGAEKRTKITYDEIPEVLIDAIVATEDSRFFEHKGVDWARFLKASVYQLLGKSGAGGASTLTMQVSKNAYTSNEASGIQGIIRKFTDVYVSRFVIEKNYTKEQIMEFYVNSQWLGKNSYGVEQTSLTYFGKSAKDLNLAEAAMLAGLFQAPGKYDPYKNPKATETRRQTVLKLMLRHGYITSDEYNLAKKMTVEKIVIPQEESAYTSGEVSQYQSFIDAVVDEVKDKTGNNPYTTPMTIYTTLNKDYQDYLNNIMNGTSYQWENDKVQAGVAVTSVTDGSVVAIGGGRNVDAIDTFNYATEITNQIGSTAKPLYDYGPAIQYNNWSTYQLIVDEPTSYSDGHSISNWDGGYEGLETIRTALRGSRNIPALKTFKANNKSKIIEFATNLGLTPEIYSCNSGYKKDGKYCIKYDEKGAVIEKIDAKKATTLHEAHAIGGYNGEAPLSMASAYAAFGNNGTYIKPYTFTKIIYTDSKEEYNNAVEKKQAMSKETAYMISSMLVTTAPNAVGGYYYINGVKYGAKTGTTNYDEETMKKKNLPGNAVNDLWVIGYNTEYSIAIWYGYDKISNEYYNVFSSGQHSRLFQAIGKKVFTNTNNFVQPEGVSSVEVEMGCATACLPSEYTPSNLRLTELFIKGTEPTTVSTRFAKLNDVTNLKATEKSGKITLTWDAIATPEAVTETYLKDKFSSLFINQSYLNSYIGGVMNYNNSVLGNLGYNIYLKNGNDIKLLDFVGTNKFETTVPSTGEYTFIVKTSYSTFKSNMSDGKSISIKSSIAKTYSCEKVGDKYYDNTGKVVTETEYNTACTVIIP